MLVEQKFHLPEQFKEITLALSKDYVEIEKKIKTASSLVENNCSLKNFQEELKLIQAIATEISSRYKQAIIIGIGGAISSSRSYTNYYNYQSSQFKLFYSDSLSLENLNNLFNEINLKESAIIVISKSGQSVETLFQVENIISKYYYYFDKQYKLGEHFFIISNGQNKLTKIAESIKARVLNYSSKSGKFSAFSMVGLLPAKLINLNPEEIIAGAYKVFDHTSHLIEAAWINYNLISSGHNINVLAYYDDKLSETINWSSQITSEITAKNGKGVTSIVSAMVDQHGAWQLFLAGPKDKYFTFFWNKENELSFDSANLIRESYYKLNRKKLIQKNVPIREIIYNEIKEETLGFLMMKMLLENIVLADFLNVPAEPHQNIEKNKRILSRIYAKKNKTLFT